MTGAAEWRTEKCGKMPLRDTFRVRQIMSGDCITLTANNDTCLLAMNECATGEIQCIHQSSMGGRMVSNGDLLRVENVD